MKIEYEKPFAELVDFRAMEMIASDGGDVDNPASIVDGVGDAGDRDDGRGR